MKSKVLSLVVKFHWMVLILSRKDVLSSCVNVENSETLEISEEGDYSDEFGLRSSFSNDERIVRDLVFLKNGIHLDFSYNETSYGKGHVPSAPGCPRSIYGRPWLYYGSPPKCYLAGFRGPCSWGKRFFSVNNSKYGVCTCDCFASFEEETATPLSASPSPPIAPSALEFDVGQNLIFSRRLARSRLYTTVVTTAGGVRKIAYNYNPNAGDGPYRRVGKKGKKSYLDPIYLLDVGEIPVKLESTTKPSPPPERYQFCYSPSFKRQVVYDSLRQECFPFLEQGPCLPDEWLVKDFQRENGIECEKRKCPLPSPIQGHEGGSFTYFDYLRQQCLTDSFGPQTVDSESFYSNAGSILTDRSQFCKEAGMRYSSRLKTCVKDSSRQFNFKVIG